MLGIALPIVMPIQTDLTASIHRFPETDVMSSVHKIEDRAAASSDSRSPIKNLYFPAVFASASYMAYPFNLLILS